MDDKEKLAFQKMEAHKQNLEFTKTKVIENAFNQIMLYSDFFLENLEYIPIEKVLEFNEIRSKSKLTLNTLLGRLKTIQAEIEKDIGNLNDTDSGK